MFLLTQFNASLQKAGFRLQKKIGQLSGFFNGQATTMLANGIRISTRTVPASRLVSCDVRVSAGSVCDPPGKDGLAHLIEHVLSGPYKIDRHMIDFDQNGGYRNAKTSPHATIYSFRQQWNGLSSACSLFDFIGNLIAVKKIDSHLLANEKKIVINECNTVHKSDQLSIVQLTTNAVRNQAHRSAIGTVETINAIQPEDAEAFLRQHYTGRNMVIEITSPMTHGAVVAMARNAFENMPSGEPAAPSVGFHSGYTHMYPDNPDTVMGLAFPLSGTGMNYTRPASNILATYIDVLLKEYMREGTERFGYIAEASVIDNVIYIAAGCDASQGRSVQNFLSQSLKDIANGVVDARTFERAVATSRRQEYEYSDAASPVAGFSPYQQHLFSESGAARLKHVKPDMIAAEMRDALKTPLVLVVTGG